MACLIKVTLSKDLYSFGLELSSILPIAIQLILFGLKFSEIKYWTSGSIFFDLLKLVTFEYFGVWHELNRKAADYFYSAGTSSLLVKDFKMANNAYTALQRLSNQESYITKKSKKLKELIAELSVFNDNNFKIVKVNTKVNWYE